MDRLRHDVSPREVAYPLAIGAVGVLAALFSLGWWGFSYDDNFITYRYADNLRLGNGFTFNAGERVFGTTAPGYGLLLGGLALLGDWLGVGVPEWGTLVTALSLTSLCVVALAVANRAGSTVIPALGFAVLSFSSGMTRYLSGSEVFPVLALVSVAGWHLWGRGRPATAGAMMAVAMAMRLDAGLAAAAFGLAEWRRAGRFPVRYAVTAGLGLTAWLTALYVYFGSLVPNTLAGKAALAAVPYTLRQWQALTLILPPLSAVVLLAGAVLGVAAIVRAGSWRRPEFLAAASWIGAHEIVYRAAGVWFAPWYSMYLFQALLALYCVGSWALARHLVPRQRQQVVVALILLAFVAAPSIARGVEAWGQPIDSTYAVYREVGEFIATRTPADARVLAFEIGVIGYFGGRHVLDYGGLVSPAFAAAKFSDSRDSLAARLQPDVIVSGTPRADLTGVLGHPDLVPEYREAARFGDDAVGDVHIFVRVQADESGRGTPFALPRR